MTKGKIKFKTDIRMEDVVRARPNATATGSKYDVVPIGAYIETDSKNSKKVYQNLYAYGVRKGRKFSSVTDAKGKVRIFRVA